MQNVYIFVADALRWDFLPEAVKNKGIAKKTVAASTLSPTSFASIVSGNHMPKHGVRTFSHRLPQNVNNILNANEYNTSFYQRKSADPIFDVLRQDYDSCKQVGEMKPPFINIERSLLTHSPYGKEINKFNEDSFPATEFINKNTENIKDLKDEYKKGAQRAGEVFNSRVQELRSRDLLEDTLVIFTSDHGELLGEYASVSHTSPLVPELVYVPTVILHPKRSSLAWKDETIISHVDITQTVIDELEIADMKKTSGSNIFRGPERRKSYCGYHFPKGYAAFGEDASKSSQFNYLSQGVWEKKGGWAVYNKSLPTKVYEATHSLTKTNYKILKQEPIEYIKLLYLLLHSSKKFGQPNFGKNEALSTIAKIESDVQESEQSEISDEKLKNLQYLGYK